LEVIGLFGSKFAKEGGGDMVVLREVVRAFGNDRFEARYVRK
jgi:hypothetical protein